MQCACNYGERGKSSLQYLSCVLLRSLEASLTCGKQFLLLPLQLFFGHSTHLEPRCLALTFLLLLSVVIQYVLHLACVLAEAKIVQRFDDMVRCDGLL